MVSLLVGSKKNVTKNIKKSDNVTSNLFACSKANIVNLLQNYKFSSPENKNTFSVVDYGYVPETQIVDVTLNLCGYEENCDIKIPVLNVLESHPQFVSYDKENHIVRMDISAEIFKVCINDFMGFHVSFEHVESAVSDIFEFRKK